MAVPVFYSFRRCPYAMRARMAVMVSGQTVRLREILLRDKPDEMLVVSSKGTVPVLHFEDGRVLDESLQIMHWALAGHDPEQWIPDNTEAQEKITALIGENDGPFKHHLDRYKYSTRYDDVDKQEHRTEGARFLYKLNARLVGAGYLFEGRCTLADIAIFPFVRQFRIADTQWFDDQDWTSLKAWLSTCMETPLFQSVMVKYNLWKETGREYAFPDDISMGLIR